MTAPRDRRQFLKKIGLATLATASLGAMSRGVAHAAARVSFARTPSARWNARRPFNIVAIGDSIVWGQGLATEAKFTSLTRAWLEQRLQAPVTLTVFAHSGAVIARRPDDSSCIYKTVYAGEPPNLSPSITAQAWRAAGKGPAMCAGDPAPAAPNDEVDLVIMDGGINDVDIAHILNPAYGDLLELTRRSCRIGMSALLGDVAMLFPNAKVLVTGYYQIVSDVSDISVLGPALLNVGVLGVPAQFTAFARGYGGEPQLRRRLAKRCADFHRTATTSYRTAIAKVNHTFGRDYRFVDPKFGPRNAIGAAESWLWPVDANDPARPGRIEQCIDRYGKLSVLPDAGKCRAASMGHPNERGAREYGEAIIRELKRMLG